MIRLLIISGLVFLSALGISQETKLSESIINIAEDLPPMRRIRRLFQFLLKGSMNLLKIQ